MHQHSRHPYDSSVRRTLNGRVFFFVFILINYLAPTMTDNSFSPNKRMVINQIARHIVRFNVDMSCVCVCVSVLRLHAVCVCVAQCVAPPIGASVFRRNKFLFFSRFSFAHLFASVEWVGV